MTNSRSKLEEQLMEKLGHESGKNTPVKKVPWPEGIYDEEREIAKDCGSDNPTTKIEPRKITRTYAQNLLLRGLIRAGVIQGDLGG